MTSPNYPTALVRRVRPHPTRYGRIHIYAACPTCNRSHRHEADEQDGKTFGLHPAPCRGGGAYLIRDERVPGDEHTPRDVPCSRCKAQPGEACTWGRKPPLDREYHLVRQDRSSVVRGAKQREERDRADALSEWPSMSAPMTFRGWLSEQRRRDDAVGDIAREVLYDRGYRVTTPEALVQRIDRVGGTAPGLTTMPTGGPVVERAKEAAAKAGREWRAS